MSKEKEVDPLLKEDQNEPPKPEEPKKADKKAAKDKVLKASKPVEPPKPEEPKVPVKMTPAGFLADSAAKTKAMLDAGPHSMFMIPLAPGEKVGAYEITELNGYKLTIKKGCMVKLPDPIIEILAKHYQIQMTAGQDKLIDRDSSVQNALS